MIESAVARERTNVLPGNTRLLTDVRVGGRGRREAVLRPAFVSGLIRRKATDRDDNRPSSFCSNATCGRPSRLLP